MEPIAKTSVADSSSKDLPLLQAFVAVVAAGSFTAAAKRARIDKSLLSRRVQALEEQLGVRLLQRTTRTLSVTDAGRSLYAAVAEPLDTIASALQQAAEPEELSGHLRVATLPALASQIVIPAVKRMHAAHPDVAIELFVDETQIDLVGEGVDLGLRAGRLADSSLISRKLGSWRYVLCAAPAWLAAHPEAVHPEAIADAWVLYSDVANASLWKLERGDQLLELRVKPVLSVDEAETQLEAVLQGVGVTALPPNYIHDHLQAGRLVRLLPAWRVAGEFGLFATYPHRSLVPRRVSAFIDIAAELVREREPQWRAISE